MVEIASIDNVVKDIGEIYARLFDHRPFVQGEINFFLKEFEEKRNDREIEQLFEILENVTEIRETQLDKAQRQGDTNLCNLTGNLEVALRMCSKIVEREEETSDREELLTYWREKRRKEWEAFLKDIQDKNNQVDHAFVEKENELRKYYRELEEKMHISSQHVAPLS
ncbi:biogenesis of lysosome-related organelles complex 1 subunit 5-like isoform X2 [Limulus polyphemus]|uniref:Biogenesis of lysosome-related organelles complex 1 subunit 5 n=1 Tax=Limulus polyphemus TaxID=6850 RepID=A0ABM1B6A1_LIMPO|nr:biogenesis of lysosome-related organelles complex 1 subunit 5-like isoform X2 [Limulus polyphemus]